MQLTVKTLKGGKFPVEAEPSNTVAEVKNIIESANSEMPAAAIKLIHSGKVLKDDLTLEAAGVKPNDFLVVMVTKPKKAAAVETPTTPTAAPATPASTETPAIAAATAAETPATSGVASEAPPAPARPPAEEFPAEVVSNLTGMGFPEPEVRHCLRAANGNPDIAVEFLTNGIPEDAEQVASQPAALSGGGATPLQNLRNHPQFDDLRRLVQSNPQMLQQVLTQIGQQQPELLQEINGNQAVFLQMMNEPVSDAAPRAAASSSPAAPAPPAGGLSPEMMAGMADPAQMVQMMQNMNPQQLQMMANMMGLSPEQLQAVGRMIGQMPPEQLQGYMQQAMQQGGDMDDGEGFPGGAQVLRLSEEEMAAVDRLTEMGFDRADAAQAFLACDKNEALAANLLMDGGFGFGNDDSGGNEGGDDMDDMYD